MVRRLGRAGVATEFGVPEQILGALEEIFGEPVNRVKVFQESRFARLHGRVLATTRRDRIYLTISGTRFLANPELVLHEYFHVIRQWNSGELTVPRYALACVRGGYRNNRFEVAARQFARDHLTEFRDLADSFAYHPRRDQRIDVPGAVAELGQHRA